MATGDATGDATSDDREQLLARMLAWAEPKFPAGSVTREGGRLDVRRGSARVFLLPVVSGESAPALIRMTALVVRQPQLTLDLLRMLLEENTTQLFARFGLNENGDVQLDYAMSAECSEQEFLFALLSFVDDANALDDEIVQQWGGKTFEDWVRPVEESGARRRVSRLFRRGE